MPAAVYEGSRSARRRALSEYLFIGPALSNPSYSAGANTRKCRQDAVPTATNWRLRSEGMPRSELPIPAQRHDLVGTSDRSWRADTVRSCASERAVRYSP